MWDLIVSVSDHCLSFYFKFRLVNQTQPFVHFKDRGFKTRVYSET